MSARPLARSTEPALAPEERAVVDLIRAAWLDKEIVPQASPDLRDWARLLAAARRHGLAPLLNDALKQVSLDPQPPAAILSELQLEMIRTEGAQLAALRQLKQLLARFETAGVPAVLLKGAALALTLYPAPGQRRFFDLDILVPEAQLERARRVLREHGLAPAPELRPGFELAFSGQQVFADKSHTPVDLHRHLLVVSYYRQRLPIAWFLERTCTIQFDECALLGLVPTAQLIYLAAHLALHHWDRRLLWSLDLALLLSRRAEEIAWDETIAAAQRFGLLLPLRAALAEVEAVWRVGAPVNIAAQLDGYSPPRGERTAFAIARVANPDVRTVWNGLSARTLERKLVFLSAYAFPSADYMRARYRVPSPLLLPLYYLARLAGNLLKVARSLVLIARVLTRG